MRIPLLLLFLLSELGVSAMSDSIYTEKKIIKKSVKVDQSDRLVISNQFGDVTVHTWAKKEVSLTVTVRGRAYTKQRGREIVGNANITERIRENSNHKIAFTTIVTTPYHNNNGVNGILDPTDNDHGMELTVDYDVYVPDNIHLDISQVFGDVFFKNDFHGPLYLYVDYGRINAKKLAGGTKYISMSRVRTGKSFIGYLDNAWLNGADSMTIANAGNIHVEFCESMNVIRANTINVAKANCNMKIGSVNHLYGSFENCKRSPDIVIDTIVRSANINFFDCRNVRINNFGTDIERVLIYSNKSVLHFDFSKLVNMEVQLDYQSEDIGSVKNVPAFLKLNIDEYRQHYRGSNGNGNGLLNIDAIGGDITFY